ncbi:MAG: ATP-binding protein [Desulfobulbaceae bacterium]
MRFQFEHNTIMGRLVLMFVTITCLVGILSGFYVVNTLALKKDLQTIEDFYSLFNTVLELRRYEKNIILRATAEDYEKFGFYLKTLKSSLSRLEEPIDAVMGSGSVRRINRDLAEYEQRINATSKKGYDVAAVMGQGKIIVDFTQSLLERKKKHIHNSLHGIMMLVIFVTSGSFLSVLLIFYLQARSILKRLDLLRQATRDVVAGSFTPLPESEFQNDEIGNLVRAFNKMVDEIDSQQEELLQARKLASIGTFSSGIAHELNNPLNNISLTADTLQEEAETLSPEERAEMIGDIIRETERASNIVRNLLDFSREKTTRDEIIDLKELIGKTIRLIRNQLSLNYVWVEDYIPADLPRIRGDRQKLQQVFLNLFLNALQAMRGGGLIDLEGSVKDDKYVRIDVNDTGQGISSEHLAHIFDPFYTTKPVGKGTGLGLSIAYGIVKKHGGYIEVRSKVNVGTTFSVYLPIVKQEQGEPDAGGSD